MRTCGLFLVFILHCWLPLGSRAQQRFPVSWEANPRLHVIPDSLKKAPAVFVLEERRIEMGSGSADFEQYYTVHHIIHLNDNKGAEAFNTFTIPVVPGTSLHDIKARTILPNGKVVVVSKDKIKKIKSESGLPEYLLAMEAVEPGAEVEVLYTQLLPGSASGREVFQYKVPIQQALFRLIVPVNMVYELKGYNGFPQPRDSAMDDMVSHNVVARNIPALEEEESSRYRAQLQRIDYKLSYVLRTGKDKERRQTWEDMASQLHQRYQQFGSKELRHAAGLLQTIGVRGSDEELKKAIAIEDYFKSKIELSESLSDERAGEFEQIIKKKLTTERGLVRLMAACFREAGILYEVGMVGSRFGYPMDDSLEMWSHLSEYLLYLPNSNAYFAPAAVAYRYPYLPYQLAGSKGVFTRSVGPLRSNNGVGKDVRTIPQLPMDKNGVWLSVSVRFDPKDLVPIVSTNMAMHGYSASVLRPGLLYAPKDKEAELVREILGLSDKPSDVQEYDVQNTAFSSYSLGKPLIVSGTVRAAKLMEKAGPKYLFRAGELIGTQEEMYQETKRVLPVEIEYPNMQPRTLRISIPTGYKVVNPEVFRSNTSASLNGKVVAGFQSDYKMEGTDLVVTVKEFYELTSYPLSIYESYRKVINAAADFSKTVMVLQKI